jgi:DNA repair protein RadC
MSGAVTFGIFRPAMSDARIQALSAELAGLLHEKFADRPVLQNWQTVVDYLRARLVPLSLEQIRVLYLNTKNVLIEDQVHAYGTIDECPLHIREVIHHALNIGATALILAHNHPSGDPTPSNQDIRFTTQLVEATRHLKIVVHDHIIIGGEKPPLSMRAGGYL